MRCLVVLLLGVLPACVPQLDDCTEDLDCPRDRFCSGGYCLPPDGAIADAIVVDAARDQAIRDMRADATADMDAPDLAARDMTRVDGATDMAPPADAGNGCPAGPESEGAPCFTGDPANADNAPCMRGRWRCRGAVWSCVGEVLAAAEICDGIDNDCDGEIDDFPADDCSVGVGGCRRDGNRVCVAEQGAFACDVVPGLPDDEACNNDIDDDCDGSVDEGCECRDEQRPEECGSVLGECEPGLRSCRDGRLTACEGEVPPVAERCDGLDNDCDGQNDEDFEVGEACAVGVGGCQRIGTFVCVGPDAVGCDVEPGAAGREVCNDIDDDCDGNLDEGFAPGRECFDGVGACRARGVLVCTEDGGQRCAVDEPRGALETCNGRDDDCDGFVDEDVAAEPCMDGIGACQREGQRQCIDGVETCVTPPVNIGVETCNAIDDDCDGGIDEVRGLTSQGAPITLARRNIDAPAFSMARNANRIVLLTHTRTGLRAVSTQVGQNQPRADAVLGATSAHWAAARLGMGVVVAGVGVAGGIPHLDLQPISANGDLGVLRTTPIVALDHLELMDRGGNETNPVVLVHPTGRTVIRRVLVGAAGNIQDDIPAEDYGPETGFAGAINGADTHIVFRNLDGLQYVAANDEDVRHDIPTGIDGDFSALALLAVPEGAIVAGRVPSNGAFDFELRRVGNGLRATIEGVAGQRPSLAVAQGDHLVVGWRASAGGTARIAIFDSGLNALQRVDLGPAIEGPIVAAGAAGVSVAWVDLEHAIQLQHFNFDCTPRGN